MKNIKVCTLDEKVVDGIVRNVLLSAGGWRARWVLDEKELRYYDLICFLENPPNFPPGDVFDAMRASARKILSRGREYEGK